MAKRNLLTLSEAEFARLVDRSFKNYDRLLDLSHLPLADCSLIAPALVVDEVSPTADDRGRALRIVLRWAVSRLAPSPPRYPLGTLRPFDDPTWQNPHWWRYNILRHGYIDPLHPDEFFEGYQRTDTLIALMGIPDRSRWNAEYHQAIREVAGILREQIQKRHGDRELRRMAVEELYLPLEVRARARDVLGLAAIFQGSFPRTLLLEIATMDQLPGVEVVLDDLIVHRLLLEQDDGDTLLLPSAMRAYIYARQRPSDLARYHRHAAHCYLERGQSVLAAQHLLRSGDPVRAANLLLEAADSVVDEVRIKLLEETLKGFVATQLPVDLWRKVQILLSDLYRQTGDRELALAACRRALKVTPEPERQAELYHRLGKLYEHHGSKRALGYYQLAWERFAPDDPRRPDLLKDRAWIYIYNQEWGKAETDLLLALKLVEGYDPDTIDDDDIAAGIHDALASMYRRQGDHGKALFHAQESLGIREKRGDLLRVADSGNNLGLIYAQMGDSDQAIAAYEEALAIYHQLDNWEAIAIAQLNIGEAHHYAGRLEQAVIHYQITLSICNEIDLPRLSAIVCYDLAEATAAMGQVEQARHYWRSGYTCSQEKGLDDQLAWFIRLREQTPALQEVDPHGPPFQVGICAPSGTDELSSSLLQDHVALEIARRVGRVTTRALVKEMGISRATAVRELSNLVERGLLVKIGRGRATSYVLPSKPVSRVRAGWTR